jgi:hypothetical protein
MEIRSLDRVLAILAMLAALTVAGVLFFSQARASDQTASSQNTSGQNIR